MKYYKDFITGQELNTFYRELFKGTSTNYGFFAYPHTFSPIPNKEIFLPLPFLKIIDTFPMRQAGKKIQTAHTFKMHPRMDDTRLDHMVFAQSLGVDLLCILEKKGYQIDNETKIAFLVFLLTHDIGHGPFSHPFEQMVDGYKGMHEDIGRRTLEEDIELHSILESIYPGLTERVVHFKEHDSLGLSSLLEGTFDLDRAAFLIMDTFLMDGEDKEYAFYDIVNGVYKIFHNIILQDRKVYYDKACFREMDDFLRIRKENYQIYQSPERVLDDLLLKRVGSKASKAIKDSKEYTKLPIEIQEEIKKFVTFISHMKEKKKNIPLEEYYNFGDYDFERIFHFLLLLDVEDLNRDCLILLSSFSTYHRYYQMEKDKKPTGREDFYISNNFTVYKSKEDENITFLDGNTKTDYKDMVGRYVEPGTYEETLSYTLKVPPQLDREEELREKLLEEINQEFINDYYSLTYLTARYPSDHAVIHVIKCYGKCVLENISLQEFLKLLDISYHQLLTYLSMYTSNSYISNRAKMLLSESLGYYYTEEEATNILSKQQKIKQKDVI